MSRTRTFAAAAASALLFAVPPLATLPAGAAPGTHCTAEVVLTLAPGLSEQPGPGTFHSDGENGTISCDDGTTGTFGGDGRYGEQKPVTCSSGGDAWGVQSITVNEKTIKNTVTIDFGGISSGFLSGTFDGERYSGTFTYTPTEGDCFTQPNTKGTVRLDGTLTP